MQPLLTSFKRRVTLSEGELFLSFILFLVRGIPLMRLTDIDCMTTLITSVSLDFTCPIFVSITNPFIFHIHTWTYRGHTCFLLPAASCFRCIYTCACVHVHVWYIIVYVHNCFVSHMKTPTACVVCVCLLLPCKPAAGNKSTEPSE